MAINMIPYASVVPGAQDWTVVIENDNTDGKAKPQYKAFITGWPTHNCQLASIAKFDVLLAVDGLGGTYPKLKTILATIRDKVQKKLYLIDVKEALLPEIAKIIPKCYFKLTQKYTSSNESRMCMIILNLGMMHSDGLLQDKVVEPEIKSEAYPVTVAVNRGRGSENVAIGTITIAPGTEEGIGVRFAGGTDPYSSLRDHSSLGAAMERSMEEARQREWNERVRQYISPLYQRSR